MKRLLAALVAAVLLVPALVVGPVAAAGSAGYTTFDAIQGGCLDSPNGIDCNNYAAKEDVYMNGGPTNGAGLADGSYFFAVLVPGYQNGGFIDGATGNLSDTTAGGTTGDAGSGDLVANRTFTLSGGAISSYGGTHATGTDPQGNLVIQLMPYDDTSNAGGVYILAICQTGATSPSQCKYDAFRVPACSESCGGELGSPLVVSKTVNTSFTRTYTWSIVKSVDKPRVEQVGGSAIFTYTVQVDQTGFTDSAWGVTGTISVENDNAFDVTGVNVTDALSDGTTCTVTGGSDVTVPATTTSTFDYSCSPSGTDATSNQATVTWADSGAGALPAGEADYVALVDWGAATVTPVGQTVTPTDAFNGGSAVNLCTLDGSAPCTLTATDGLPFTSQTYTYSRTISIPTNGCLSYTNTAAVLDQSSPVTVTVCGPAKTGALTMGFWQNKNGQGIIGSYSGTNCQTLRAWLDGFNPFADLTATTCSGVKTYVYNVIKAANASGASMNAMLKAQDLATSLDVYFSDPALGGNRIGAPSPIGLQSIDLTKVCNMLDGSGGSATCTGTYENVSPAFGGASCLTVSSIIAYEASQSNIGGSFWYANVKSIQALAKDLDDAINNQMAFNC